MAEIQRRIVVVGAVIVSGARILCAQRGPDVPLPGFWEFPGGKVETGEQPDAALVREVQEELGCEIEVGKHITTTTYEYDFSVVELATYYAQIVHGTPQLSDHSVIEWHSPGDLSRLEWAPADIPTVQLIMRDLA